MKKNGILALDIGTSSIRASIYIKDEGIKHTLSMKQDLTERFYIQDLWDNVCHLIRTINRSLVDIHIDVMGVSAFLGWVIVNKNGEPVEKAWSWMSYGDHEELNMAKKRFPGNDVKNIIGRELNEQLGVLNWGKTIRSLTKDVILLSVKDFINYKLTHIFMMDRSHASYTGLYSIEENNWDSNLLKEFHLPNLILPELGYGSEIVGNIIRNIQSELDLSSDTKVILGGPDGTLAILGGGGFKPGSSVEVMGTTDVFFHVIDEICTKEVVANGLVQNSFVLPGLFCVGGPTGMTGGALEWLMRKKNWGYEHHDFIKMIEDWEEIKASESGLFTIPELTGARVPDWNPKMRGTVVGLNPTHNFEQVFKATLEGIAFHTKRMKIKIESLTGTINSITAIGGGAKNEKFIQTRASVAGCCMEIPKEVEASTFGVLALASLNTNWYSTVEEAISHLNPITSMIEPKVTDVKKYHPLYERYTQLVDVINDWYNFV